MNTQVIFDLIKQFNNWDVTLNGKTQNIGKTTENYIENIFKNNLTSTTILKAGSQSHPDFYLLNSNYLAEITKKFSKHSNTKEFNFIKKLLKDGKISESKIVKIEIKSGKTNSYTLNDTLPSPHINEIYILFNAKAKKVFVNTTFNMAKTSKFDYQEKYLESKTFIEKSRTFAKEFWKDTGITAATRGNYSMKSQFCDFDCNISEIENLFSAALIT